MSFRTHRHHGTLLVWMLAMGWLTGILPRLWADKPGSVTPAQFRAICMRYFVLGTTWPADSFKKKDDPIRVAIVGKTDFVPLLTQLVRGEVAPGGDVGAHPIDVVEAGVTEDLTRFNVVYFANADEESRDALAKLKGRPVVTVGEYPEFARAGGILCLDVKPGKSVYYYSRKAMLLARVHLGANLLQLGKLLTAEEEGNAK